MASLSPLLDELQKLKQCDVDTIIFLLKDVQWFPQLDVYSALSTLGLFAMMSMILGTVYCVCTAVSFVTKRRERHSLFRNMGIKGPEPSLLAGNTDELQSSKIPHDIISSWLNRYGDIFGYYVGEMPHLVIKNVEILEKILKTDFNVFHNRPFALDMSPYDKSLLGLKDQRWQEVRSILAKTFSKWNIKTMAGIINEKVDITVKIITEKAEKNEIFDIHELFQGLSVDVIADCALAMQTRCQENPKDPFFNTVRDTFKHVQNGALKLAMMFPFIGKQMVRFHKFTPAGKMTSVILNSLKKAISERIKNPEMKRSDMLQSMMNNREDENKKAKAMTDEEILSNSFIFLVAGFETTSNTLSFTIYLLVKHPDIQERLYQEIAEAGNDDYETIQNLQYLDQVITESLRIYPPATLFTSRECNQDYRVGPITIPKGTAVVAPVWDIHHDPDLWPYPFEFDPDRFSPENKTSLHKSAYMPFGLGRRNCIGSHFALSEAKLVLFRLLKRFKFEASENTENPLTFVCTTAVIGPANGVHVRAVLRPEKA